jgi:hypothetical protein
MGRKRQVRSRRRSRLAYILENPTRRVASRLFGYQHPAYIHCADAARDYNVTARSRCHRASTLPLSEWRWARAMVIRLSNWGDNIGGCKAPPQNVQTPSCPRHPGRGRVDWEEVGRGPGCRLNGSTRCEMIRLLPFRRLSFLYPLNEAGYIGRTNGPELGLQFVAT